MIRSDSQDENEKKPDDFLAQNESDEKSVGDTYDDISEDIANNVSENGNTDDENSVKSGDKDHVGGFFDSLIADFSLDEIPEKKNRDDENAPDDESEEEIIPEIVDGIIPDIVIPEEEKINNDSVVIFDEIAEENLNGERFASEEEETKKVNFFRSLFPMKGDSVWEIIRKIIFLIAVIVFIVAAVLLIINIRDSKQAVEDMETDKSIIVTTVQTTINEEGEVVTVEPTEEEVLEHNFSVMEYYKGINPDIVGFIELEGCGIAQPVTQGDDNDYYLKHTYYNSSNQAGSIFADYRCTISEDYMSPNLVLYGHNQRDGTMFGQLKLYKYNVDFYKENAFVTFNTEFDSEKYVIFGFFVTNTKESQDRNGEVFHYHDYIETLSNSATFGWYLDEIEERNEIISPIDVKYGDRLLVLSTCSNEYSDSRFVVFARLLRDGEDESSFDFSQTTLNPNAKGIDWDAVNGWIVTTSRNSQSTRITTATATTTTTAEETTTAPPTETEEETATKKKKRKKKTETQASEETTITTTVPETKTTTETTTTEVTATTTETTTKQTTTTETTTTTPYIPVYTGPIGTTGTTGTTPAQETAAAPETTATPETVEQETAAPEILSQDTAVS